MGSWRSILLQENNPELPVILRLLQSETREDNVNGALLMGRYASETRDDITRKKQAEMYSEEIFKRILALLRKEDMLCQYAAAWCVAWSDFDRADIIPAGLIPPIAGQLISIWKEYDKSDEFMRMISLGLSSVLTPGLQIVNTSVLQSAIERSLQSENMNAKCAATCLGILNHQLTGQDVREHLKKVNPLFRRARFLRELGYVDERGNILDENGNIIEEYP